ncbi:hypothetical protein [Actinoplanes regularis]|uniref:Uncharacterized protein n=1 Tax=Actinoplanes regularis TaxID=52697 RepID=A0A239FJV4_9ACTN|nr:hypothetical protein [Actinoplanes regularis]GIE89635.1 hypothetical protein Are01nite_61150 [Actinoplanes regularis]SNS57095.1 hypothetical protein SAMN06264365_118115 [Actinoplanes regularis]
MSGLKLDVAGRGRPDLAVHMAAGGRLLLRQGDQPVLLAKVFTDYSGVEYLVTDRFRSPIAPLRASQAAAIADSGNENSGERWAHHFASALESALGPLYDGSWLLDTRHTRLEHSPWGPVATQPWTRRLLAENPWTLPGGGAAWDAIAQAHAPGWFDLVKQFIDNER